LYFVLIGSRSDIHKTTFSNGQHREDPKGWHVTLCFKDADQLARGTHVASHGYVRDQYSFELVEATHSKEKPDSTLNKEKKPVWPAEHKLWVAPDIGYCHLEEQSIPDEPAGAPNPDSWQTFSNTQASEGSTSYNQSSPTLDLLPSDTPFVSVALKHGKYRFRNESGKPVETLASDWKNASFEYEAEVRSCVAYTGKRSGKTWFTWALPTK